MFSVVQTLETYLLSLSSNLFTNTFTPMHVKNKEEHETRSLHCGLPDRPLHMTDVKLFTHAFSANVSAESAHSSMTGSLPRGVSVNIPGTCVELHNAGRISRNNTEKYNVCFLKIYTIKFTQYINLQGLPNLRCFSGSCSTIMCRFGSKA